MESRDRKRGCHGAGSGDWHDLNFRAERANDLRNQPRARIGNGRRAGVAHERERRALAQFFNDAFDHGRVGIRIESFYGCMNIKMRQ